MTELIKNEPGPNEKKNNFTYFDISDEPTKTLTTSKGDKYTLTREGKIFLNDKEVNYSRTQRGPWMRVCFRGKGVRKTQQVHRLMLEAFRPITNSNVYQVNHIDGNSSNNRLDNLEWVTQSQNMQHARSKNNKHMDLKKAVGVQAHNVFTEEILEFTDMRECCLHFGFDRDKLIRILNKYPFGFITEKGWRYRRLQDKREFKPATHLEISKMGNGFIRPLSVYNVLTKEETEVPSLTEASRITSISMPALSSFLSKNKDIIPLISHKTKEVWEVQYKATKTTWKDFDTYWHCLAFGRIIDKPVVAEFENGTIYIFENGREASKELSLATSTISFRLKTIEGKQHKTDGLVLWFFSNWYELNKEKYTKEQINSGFIPGNKF